MDFLGGRRTPPRAASVSLIDTERGWERLRVHVHFLAPQRRGRAEAPTLSGEEEKSAVGPQQRLTGRKMIPPPSFICAQVCTKHVKGSETTEDSTFLKH